MVINMAKLVAVYLLNLCCLNKSYWYLLFQKVFEYSKLKMGKRFCLNFCRGFYVERNVHLCSDQAKKIPLLTYSFVLEFSLFGFKRVIVHFYRKHQIGSEFFFEVENIIHQKLLIFLKHFKLQLFFKPQLFFFIQNMLLVKFQF